MTAAALATVGHAEPIASARSVIAAQSKSFALAARLLPRAVRDDAVVLYAYCRRVDDAIDCAPTHEQPTALAELHDELIALYGESTLRDPLLSAFARLVRARAVPRRYLDELLAGMAMDVAGMRYATLAELLGYCHRVAGTVGLMMCHVMGVRHPRALRHAAHLGIAMQLTNIARDVLEDWERGRLYLPDDLLAAHGAADLRARLGGALPAGAAAGVAATVNALLDRADAYYRSGDAGLRELSPRCALAVRAARLVYSRIGSVLRARGCDPRCGRAVVGRGAKLALLARAALETLLSLPRALTAAPPQAPRAELSSYEAVVLQKDTR
jgi:phytoene synthase